jgi:hypothetical protein
MDENPYKAPQRGASDRPIAWRWFRQLADFILVIVVTTIVVMCVLRVFSLLLH